MLEKKRCTSSDEIISVPVDVVCPPPVSMVLPFERPAASPF